LSDSHWAFPRDARLSSKADYQYVFNRPVKSVDYCFTVLARKSETSHARLGLAISKKCARRAVDRNRLKRVVRETFRLERQNLTGLDFVVLCRTGAGDRSNRELAAILVAHFQRIRHRLCGSS
jgi:ribonuclease P protein component